MADKVKELEGKLRDQELLIQHYEAAQATIDQKFKVLDQIHTDKVRSLMNSIQVLKKECAQLKNMDKGNKRSTLIEQLNGEIKDQDTVIETLRKIINDEQRCDNEIIKALNQGPPKVKALTREEMKLEVKKYKAQIDKFKQQKEESIISNASTASNQSLQVDDFLKKQIQEVTEKYSTALAEIQSLNTQVQSLNTTIDDKDLQIKKLLVSETNLTVLSKKYEVLQKQIAKFEQTEAGREYNQLQSELEFEEQRILNSVKEGKIETMKQLMLTEQEKQFLLQQRVVEENQKLKQDLEKLNQQCNKVTLERNQHYKELIETQRQKKQMEINYEASIEVLNFDLEQARTEISNLQIKIDNQLDTIDKLEGINQKLNLGIQELEVDLQRIMGEKVSTGDKDYDLEINRKIQKMLQRTQNDPNDLKEVIRQQQLHFEQMMKLKNNKQQKQLSEISSNISGLLRQQHEDLDGMSSNVSDFQQREYPDVNSDIGDGNSDIDSNVSIPNAPKQHKKQADQTFSQLNSSVHSSVYSRDNLDGVSSNVSDQQNMSKVSSNISKQSFTSSMRNQVFKKK